MPNTRAEVRTCMVMAHDNPRDSPRCALEELCAYQGNPCRNRDACQAALVLDPGARLCERVGVGCGFALGVCLQQGFRIKGLMTSTSVKDEMPSGQDA